MEYGVVWWYKFPFVVLRYRLPPSYVATIDFPHCLHQNNKRASATLLLCMK